MIKDVMVHLDGSAADDTRLAAVAVVAERFEAHVTALYFNILPVIIAGESDDYAAIHSIELIEMARKAGDRTEAALATRLSRMQFPAEIRRFDVFGDAVGDIAAREARAADEFIGLRPNGASGEPDGLVESVLFGAGRHLLLVPADRPSPRGFDHVLIAWNGSREAARALAEAMSYVRAARSAVVVVVDDEPPVEDRAMVGRDAVDHLRHHGVHARLHHVTGDSREAGAAIIGEAQRTGSDLIVMGGYGHSRLREMLLGGVTRELMHSAPLPLLIAH